MENCQKKNEARVLPFLRPRFMDKGAVSKRADIRTYKYFGGLGGRV